MSALAGGDHHRREARPVGLGDSDTPARAQRPGYLLDRLEGGGLGEPREVAVGDADPEAGDPAPQLSGAELGRTLGADGVSWVRPLERVEGDREVADRAREGPDVIEARREQDDPGARHAAVRRLQPEDTAQRRRDADRAVGVGAERGTSPAATAAAEPPEEPPAMRVGSCGLRVGP